MSAVDALGAVDGGGVAEPVDARHVVGGESDGASRLRCVPRRRGRRACRLG